MLALLYEGTDLNAASGRAGIFTLLP